MNQEIQRNAAARSYPKDARVPPFAEWPRAGLVGRIGRGPDTGKLVLIDLLRDARTGAVVAYSLEVPHSLYDAQGDLVLDDGCVDVVRSESEGGLIDHLTTSLDVEWSTDAAAVEEAWQSL